MTDVLNRYTFPPNLGSSRFTRSWLNDHSDLVVTRRYLAVGNEDLEKNYLENSPVDNLVFYQN